MIIEIKEKDLDKNLEKIKTVLNKNDYNFKKISINKKILLITSSKVNSEIFNGLNIIEKIHNIKTEYQLCSSEFRKEKTTIRLSDNICFGSKSTIMMAGPCTVESREQTFKTAEFLKENFNIKIFRAGAFKPRTSPYSFQGLKDKGLKILEEVKREFDVKIITEVKDSSHLNEVSQVADIIQVGTKSMFDFQLLEDCGKLNNPILLKRSFMSTIKEFLQCADFIMSNGNQNVILCERGIRTFETATRFTLDVCSTAILKDLTHLPIVLDPSHAIGIAKYVSDIAAVSSALGVDGLLIETHPNPEQALCDKEQALSFNQFKELYNKSKKICNVIGRDLI